MNQTAEAWLRSPARKLTIASHLPEYGKNTSKASIAQTEYARQDDTLRIIQMSGEELGRQNSDRRLYLDVVGEQYGRVNFLARCEELASLSAAIEHSGIDIDSQDRAVKEVIKSDLLSLDELNERLSGAINPERYEAIVARTRISADTILVSTDSSDSLRQSAERVLQVFPDADPELADKYIYKPSRELLDGWRPAVQRKYRDLIDLVDASKQTYNSSELVTLFNNSISVMAHKWGLPNASRWHAEIGGTNINVDMEAETVWVPETRSCSAQKAIGLNVHEIGGHLLRNLLGELSDDAFLATDLPGRGIDEEALLVLIEQVLSGQARESGLPYYVAVGLARGTLGAPKVHLADLENLMLDYTVVNKGRPLTDKEVTASQKSTFRVTRGMPSFVIDDELFQVPYGGDLKYALGQENAVEFMTANLGNPTALDIAMYGKYAYSNPEQWQYALDKTRHLTGLAVPSAA